MSRFERQRSNPRAAAMAAITSALAGQSYVADRLRFLNREMQLENRDAGLARQIAMGALRHVLTLDCVLAAVADYEPDRVRVELRAALLAGAHQLIYLDRIPEFAAVDECVRLARDGYGRGAGGMVNAILRNLGRAIDSRRGPWPTVENQTGDVGRALQRAVRVSWSDACHFGFDIFSKPSEAGGVRYLAEASGEKFERVQSFVARFGFAKAAEIAWASQAVPPLVVQRNSLRCSGSEFREAILAIDAAAAFDDDETPLCAYLPPESGVASSELLQGGKSFIQDATARAAARLLGAKRGERIADWCAAPGGKTLALAIDQHDAGEILALDDSRERLKRVEENVQRLGLRSVRVQAHGQHADRDRRAATSRGGHKAGNSGGPNTVGTSAGDPAGSRDQNIAGGRVKKAGGNRDHPSSDSGQPAGGTDSSGFDAVLADVPCSNSGVIARRPEARLDRGPVKLESLRALQRQILADAAATVRPGGRLVYSTCSIDAGENEEIVSAFVRANPGWTVEASELTLPHWGARASEWCDGGFAVRLVRST